MKILQIVHGFPPEAIAGTERYCEALSRRLLGRGHECLVLAGSERGAPEATLSTVEQDSLLVTRYLMAERRPHRWMDEYDPEAEGLARHLLALVNPEVVHLHHWLYLTNNLVAICSELGVPVVVTLHDVWTSCPRVHRIRSDGVFCSEPPATAPCLTCAQRAPWDSDREIASALSLRREMMETELALADAIIVPSEAHRALLLSLFDLPQERLIVLPHGCIPTLTPQERIVGNRELPNRPLQIGYWGYLTYEKGTHLILEAVHKLRDPLAVQVHLYGTIVEQGYEQWLCDLARDIPVQFHGSYRPADLRAFDLDLAVFASIASESYAIALDEALRLGLPVLVSDRGALPERIGKAGLTFRAEDAKDLARRLQEILDTPELLDMMRRNIRPDTFFSMEAHVAMLEKIYEDAINTKGPKRSASTPYLKLIAQAKREVGRLQAQVEEAEAKAQVERQERQEREQQIQALSAQVAAITGSTAWRLAQALRRVGLRIAPLGSRRERVLRLWIRILGVREQ